MIFHYNNFLSKHWIQLSKMLEDSYMTPENEDSVVIMGLHCHYGMQQCKRELASDKKLILYQTEPLVNGEHWHSIDKIINNINGADEVWDYDLENIEILRSHGIEAKFCPPAYSERLSKSITNIENPDIDILFYGSYSEHRYKILHDLHMEMPNNNYTRDFLMNRNIVWLHNITDSQLDHFIGRSKIVLNLKPYEHTVRQQQTRIYYPLINNKCVLSEKCNINYFGDNIYEFDSIPELHERVLYLLENDNWSKRKINHLGWVGTQNKSKIAVFYHVCQVNNWFNMFQEQISKLQKSGLYDDADYIHIGINGETPLPLKLFKANRIKFNKNFYSEIDTLIDLYNFARANPDYKILYFHTKGVTHANCGYPELEANVDAWRKYMEYFCIEKWKESSDKLKDFDTVGVDWLKTAHINNEERPMPHYAGNFWWANSNYISKLDISYLKEDTPWKRYNCEFWIGTKNPKSLNLHSSHLNKYGDYIDPISYRN